MQLHLGEALYHFCLDLHFIFPSYFNEMACWALALLFFMTAQEMLETTWQLWGLFKWCNKKNKEKNVALWQTSHFCATGFSRVHRIQWSSKKSKYHNQDWEKSIRALTSFTLSVMWDQKG